MVYKLFLQVILLLVIAKLFTMLLLYALELLLVFPAFLKAILLAVQKIDQHCGCLTECDEQRRKKNLHNASYPCQAAQASINSLRRYLLTVTRSPLTQTSLPLTRST